MDERRFCADGWRATHSNWEDYIAPLDRTDWLSDHSNNPVDDLSGVDVFDSGGGSAPSFVTPSGDTMFGDKTQGDNADATNNPLYIFNDAEFWFTGMHHESVGYLDPRSQSFLEAVGQLAAGAIDGNTPPDSFIP